jgi:hypothetical protein
MLRLPLVARGIERADANWSGAGTRFDTEHGFTCPAGALA